MKPIDALLPRVMEVVPVVPEPLAVRHLRDAAIEFCRRTRIWRERDTVEIDAEEGWELVIVKPNAALFEIRNAVFKGPSLTRDLEPITVDRLDAEHPGWDEEPATPRWITQSAPDTVRVAPKPEEDGEVVLEMVLVPTDTTDVIPDVLVDTYGQVLADGALGRILMMPSQDWANPELGALHAAAFDAALGRWSNLVPRGQMRARRRTRASSYF